MLPAALLALSLLAPLEDTHRAAIEGLWLNPIGSAIIEIAPCGNKLCGKVVWASERGRREAAKGAHDVVGSVVLTGLTRAGDHWSGNLFVPDDNIHVSAKLRLLQTQRLMLTGCMLAGMFCRSQVWTRFDKPLP